MRIENLPLNSRALFEANELHPIEEALQLVDPHDRDTWMKMRMANSRRETPLGNAIMRGQPKQTPMQFAKSTRCILRLTTKRSPLVPIPTGWAKHLTKVKYE